MVLFLVISDTHGDVLYTEQLIARFPQVKDILHLGDYAKDAARLSERHSELRIHAVCGNCDMGADPVRFPLQRELEVEGKRLFLTHGHRYAVKDGYDRLVAKGTAGQFDLVLFGHTHIAADLTVGGIHLLNPGSLSHPKGMEGPSYALVEIGHGLIETRLMEI